MKDKIKPQRTTETGFNFLRSGFETWFPHPAALGAVRNQISNQELWHHFGKEGGVGGGAMI